MSRMRRTMAVLVMVLLVAGAFASPAFAQTTMESATPYGPDDPDDPDDPEGPDDDVGVGGVVIVDDDDDVEAVRGTPEPTVSVMGVTLARTGVDAILLGVVGLLALGLGGFLLLRSRRRASEA